MPEHLLVANRGEIAIRILRTAADLGIRTTAIHATDDAASLHTRHADNAIDLGNEGVAAYLDIESIVRVANEVGADAVHPGYGFLSESSAFASACEKAGIRYVGPAAETLAQFGDKAAARALAEQCDVPVLPGVSRAISLSEAEDFFSSLASGNGVMLKAIAGGGGRGMRPVFDGTDLASSFNRATSEAAQAFGSGDIYVEELLPRARHIEVQIIGDGTGDVSHLWDRECSLQRQRQKIVEIAPAFGLTDQLRADVLDAAVRIGSAANYQGVGTIEFLIDVNTEGRFVFMEANARLQVEHTVTEMITGLDLVALQLKIADGATLPELGIDQVKVPQPQGAAIQCRINLESMNPDGTSRPGGGYLTAYEPASGPGVRVDGYGYTGYTTSPFYDSLLAKLIVHGQDLTSAARKTRRALSEFKLEGVRSNIGFLQVLLKETPLDGDLIHTRYVEEQISDLLAVDSDEEPARFFSPERDIRKAGADVDPDDPLAVLNVQRSDSTAPAAVAAPPAQAMIQGPPGTEPVLAPIQGMVIDLTVTIGDEILAGQPVAVLEALKMEHVIKAEQSGIVRELPLSVGDTIFEDTPIVFIEPSEVAGEYNPGEALDLNSIRDDVAEINHFHQLTTDEARVEATTKRHNAGKRTARENINDLCDDGTFFEYGPLVTATRYRNDTIPELEERVIKTAADAMVMGVGKVNSNLVGPENARCVAMSYDYTVLAGTQGGKNHQKQDRMFNVAEKYKLPLVLYTEGGGGRTHGGPRSAGGPGASSVGGLNTRTWRELGKLSGLVPIVGVNSGYCFAGNVVLLGACDVIIATEDSSLGVGGPALIEGGGLGVFAPSEVGPVSIQEPNGVIDVVVKDEIEATDVARRYLSYFQGRVSTWQANDQRKLRHIVPENRRAIYSIREVIETLADAGTVLELRPKFGLAMVTAFIRIEGRPVGVIANNSNSPTGGAIDADAADKASRFMQLCDAFDIPVLSLIDCPGNMVGPEAEKEAQIRHCGRMYVAGANLTVPFFAVILRKSYGLGALAMSTGSFDETFFAISWPTGEFAGMGLEGSIKLGRRSELAAIEDIPKRKARYEELVADAYAWSRALNAGTVFEVDDVIDPATTRDWLIMGLESAPPPEPRAGKKHKWIDTW
ncbi:MAG: carbamoyl-phosphate synthase large subunit [OM182 bacterium MED-G24]|uniref:Carbamoyl-phosphate synthase large subunit n=1 Tax=OM182 bacterium MED-G24 TaxID=1986255 RepID=A0A2A5WGX4_9GAMM|nr:MAG: carbamoyl-phosphate synthase large subunit [OM182 bacterium MED-G24]